MERDEISFYRYHGYHREAELLSEHDIVATTYNTVASEYKRKRGGAKNVFSFHWHRIILDEGMSTCYD